jgi:hypothetical protein
MSTSVTIKKDFGAFESAVTIELNVDGQRFGIGIPEPLPCRLDPTPECLALYGTPEKLLRGCLAGASQGIFDATRAIRQSCGRVSYLRLEGVHLPPRCAQAFGVAAAFACLHAIGRDDLRSTVPTEGWKDTACTD